MVRAVLAVVVAAACSHGGSNGSAGSGDSGKPEPIGNQGSGTVIEIDAAPEQSDCVKDCIARNQMRAVGIEVIEADCRRDCGAHSALDKKIDDIAAQTAEIERRLAGGDRAAAGLEPAPDAPPQCQRYLELVKQYLQCDKLSVDARDHALRSLTTKRLVWGPGLTADGFAAMDESCAGSIRDLQTAASVTGCAIEPQ